MNMNTINFLKTHKMSILSVLLVAVAAVLGADSSFAMAVDPVDLAANPNPSDEANGGIEARPAGEKPVEDLAGLKTTQHSAATATDVKDAGLEAEDYDKDVVEFNKFKYASETILASKVKPIKVKTYTPEHFRIGQPDLDAVAKKAVTIGAGINKISVSVDDISNVEALIEYAVVSVEGVTGYAKDAGGNEYESGNLQLFVLNHNDDTSKVVFRVSNPSATKSITIPLGTTLHVCATAGSESQMKSSPVTFLPEKTGVTLQKKIETCIMTDEFKEQMKKTPITKADVIQYVTDIFKRKCARSHWLGEGDRVDVKVKETGGNREYTYIEKGIFRQIPGLYTHDEEMSDDDFMAMSAMMFTNYAQSDNATAFCGRNEMMRIMRLINKTERMRDASKVEVNDYGIKVRKWSDNFGTIEFVYDQTFDELGMSDYMAILDLSSMVRYYKRDEQTNSLDMKKTSDQREAEIWNISRIDCYCLKGGNALVVCPKTLATKAATLGGIKDHYAKAADLAASSIDKSKIYYLTADQTGENAGLKAGMLVEYNEVVGWEQFHGRVIL